MEVCVKGQCILEIWYIFHNWSLPKQLLLEKPLNTTTFRVCHIVLKKFTFAIRISLIRQQFSKDFVYKYAFCLIKHCTFCSIVWNQARISPTCLPSWNKGFFLLWETSQSNLYGVVKQFTKRAATSGKYEDGWRFVWKDNAFCLRTTCREAIPVRNFVADC